MSEKQFSKYVFDGAKERFLRFADVVRKANTADELRAMLIADTQAQNHSYDMLELMSITENIGFELCRCMSETIDPDGIPLGDPE
jgi:16S rRNA G527 N7-methylase RsmG